MALQHACGRRMVTHVTTTSSRCVRVCGPSHAAPTWTPRMAKITKKSTTTIDTLAIAARDIVTDLGAWDSRVRRVCVCVCVCVCVRACVRACVCE